MTDDNRDALKAFASNLFAAARDDDEPTRIDVKPVENEQMKNIARSIFNPPVNTMPERMTINLPEENK